MNPELGYEKDAEEALRPQARAKRVLVVGGGPSGAEAARAAALRGHEVRLLEAKSRIGGQVLTATAAEYKRMEMEAYVTYFERELEHVGVAVEVNSPFTPDHPAAEWADVIVVATGAIPAGDPVEGVNAVEAMDSRLTFDGAVTIMGANEIALNAAAFAVQQGQPTVVVTGGASAGYDMNPLLAAHTVSLLEKAGVRFVEVEESQVGTRLFAPDWVPDESEWLVPGKDVLTVGAKLKGGRLFNATQSGFWTGTKI
jgi:2,4-dienoyl-CoA reductase (NADPH2)